jgi:hypothetical protein
MHERIRNIRMDHRCGLEAKEVWRRTLAGGAVDWWPVVNADLVLLHIGCFEVVEEGTVTHRYMSASDTTAVQLCSLLVLH